MTARTLPRLATNAVPAVLHTHPVPPQGCYVPAVTFFSDDDTLDLESQAKYYGYLSRTGLHGLVILGTNAETFLLTREERKALLQCARQVVPLGQPIIAGVSGHSTAQVLEYIADAHEAGANFALLLPSAYFGKQTTPAVVKDFFAQVCAKSPLPIILYNFPAVCKGLDLDSDIITDITKQNENVVGVKLTCGSVAKIARLAAVFPPSRFAVFGGQVDFLVGGLVLGSAGCIGAFANVFPRSAARLYALWTSGRYEDAVKLQKILSLAESPTKAGIASTKFAAAITTAARAGVVNVEVLLRPRQPYREPTDEQKAHVRSVVEPIAWIEDAEVDEVLAALRLT